MFKPDYNLTVKNVQQLNMDLAKAHNIFTKILSDDSVEETLTTVQRTMINTWLKRVSQ